VSGQNVVGWQDSTDRLGADIVGGITGVKPMFWIVWTNGQFSCGAMAHVRLDVAADWSVRILFVMLKCPLTLGPVNDSEIVNTRINRSCCAVETARKQYDECEKRDDHNNDQYFRHRKSTEFTVFVAHGQFQFESMMRILSGQNVIGRKDLTGRLTAKIVD
jgi:hypothetical protein